MFYFSEVKVGEKRKLGKLEFETYVINFFWLTQEKMESISEKSNSIR